MVPYVIMQIRKEKLLGTFDTSPMYLYFFIDPCYYIIILGYFLCNNLAIYIIFEH